MERYKTSKDYFELVTEMTSSEHSKALCDGKIDAYGYVVGIPNSGVAVATEGCGAYIVELNSDVEKGLIKEFPFYGPVNIPKGAYSSVMEPVTTFGGYATIVTSAKVSEDVVYEVVRAVFENLEDFKKLHPAYSILTPGRHDQKWEFSAAPPWRREVLQRKRLDVSLGFGHRNFIPYPGLLDAAHSLDGRRFSHSVCERLALP